MSAKRGVKTTSRGTEAQSPCWTGTYCTPTGALRLPAGALPAEGPQKHKLRQRSEVFSLLSLPKPLYFPVLRGKSIKRRDTPMTPLVLAAAGK